MSRTSDRGDASPIGVCPNCGGSIPVGYELIRYETSEGNRKQYAECPECRDVVHPR